MTGTSRRLPNPLRGEGRQMRLMISRRPFSIALAALIASVSAHAAPAGNPPPDAAAPAAGSGLAVINRSCTSCHDSGQIIQARRGEDWQPIIERMRANGANISDSDAKTLLDYLIKNYSTPH